MKPKSINSLMAYMRDEKGIHIKGSLQKRKLRAMGYFHGYKGYRYCNTPNNLFLYQSFNEIQAVYDFDMRLKSMFYPQIMFIETAIKNYSLEIILNEAGSSRFADVYNKLLNDYKRHSVGSDNYSRAISKRMSVRNKVYSNISRDYGKNNIIKHYYDLDRPVPIWAIFEILSLGEFGNFFACLNEPTRKKISQSIGIDSSVDTNGRMVQTIVFTLKDLRNSVAHNNTVFDTRFKTGLINNNIQNYISAKVGITNLTFNTIVDYVILIAFVLSLLRYNKSEMLFFVKQFEDLCENLRRQVPMNIYSRIVHTDSRRKLRLLKQFLD